MEPKPKKQTQIGLTGRQTQQEATPARPTSMLLLGRKVPKCTNAPPAKKRKVRPSMVQVPVRRSLVANGGDRVASPASDSSSTFGNFGNKAHKKEMTPRDRRKAANAGNLPSWIPACNSENGDDVYDILIGDAIRKRWDGFVDFAGRVNGECSPSDLYIGKNYGQDPVTEDIKKQQEQNKANITDEQKKARTVDEQKKPKMIDDQKKPKIVDGVIQLS
uniref:HUN domain-containing protein n=1 Tax=Steinernema glaseri TaxID=37863 RepID=A0A1I7ZMW4_9BILA